MENEINTTLPEKLKALPEVISPAIEMPDITPVVRTMEITDGKPDDYTESLNSLVTKYAKSTSKKK